MSYRDEILTTILHESLLPKSHTWPKTYQSQRSDTVYSSTCKSHSHKSQQA
jgi:hypothetical protein